MSQLGAVLDAAENVTSKRRWRELTTEVLSSPLLPILGWTKLVESMVVNGPVLNWLVYALVVTALYVFADELRRRLSDAAEHAESMVEGE